MTDMPEKTTQHCPSCGGILGRDCWNPSECAEITYQMNHAASLDATQEIDIAWNEALEAAAKQLEKRIEDIVRDEGQHDYSTNVTELPEWAEDVCGELEEQAAAIRAMKREIKP